MGAYVQMKRYGRIADQPCTYRWSTSSHTQPRNQDRLQITGNIGQPNTFKIQQTSEQNLLIQLN